MTLKQGSSSLFQCHCCKRCAGNYCFLLFLTSILTVHYNNILNSYYFN